MSNEAVLEEVEEIRKTPIAFVVGCGRSGTTLLQSLLNSHPNIVATPECFFIVLLYPHYGKIKDWREKDILDFIDDLYAEPSFALWLLDRKKLTAKLISIIQFANYPLLCKMIFFEMKKDKKKLLLVVDKNPINSLFVKKLLKIFPESKFIHIIREPKDTVNAHLKRFNKKNTFFIASYWKGFNVSVEKMKSKVPQVFFTIFYENFVKNAGYTMQELCKFLSVPFDKAILQNRFSEVLPLYKENKTFERIKIVHEGLLSPINDSNIGKWKKDMNEHDVAITDIITGPFALNKYGYEREKRIINIPAHKIWSSKLQYYCWEVFFKLRFGTYKFNKYYRKRKAARAKKHK